MRKTLVLLAVMGLASAAGAQTFVNSAPILTPAGQPVTTSGPAAPYPSTIAVAGVTGATSMTVSLFGLSHTFCDDMDILLVGPGGTCIIMSDAGGSGDLLAPGIDITFADGSPLIPDNPATNPPFPGGTYGPSNYLTGDTWPAPAPAGPYGATLNNLAASANGTWSLYIQDDAGGDVGQFARGWSITFVPAPGALALLGFGGLIAGRRRRA